MNEKEFKKEIDRVMNIAYFEGRDKTNSVEFDKICNEHKERLVKLFSMHFVSNNEVTVCNCQRSGNCRFEVIMYSKQQECRHKIAN